MQISLSPTREKYPLSEKKITKKTLSGMISFLVLLLFNYFFIGIFLSRLFSESSGFVFWVLVYHLLYIFLLSTYVYFKYKYEKWYFETYYYELAEDYLIIRKGVLTPSEINVPYEKIQDVYVSQDLFDRYFGLYNVHIASATLSSSFSAHIDGVEKNSADSLRNIFLQKIKEKNILK